jgi:putative ABC transport system permease protein
MSLELFRFQDVERRTATLNEIIARVSEVPGVEAVGGSTGLPPTTAQRGTRYLVEGRDDSGQEPETANFIAVTADTFRALGTRLVRGRFFDEREQAASQKVAIINERIARRIFGDENPLGKRLKLVNPEYSDEWREIIGVVGDVKYSGLDDTARTTVYTPFAQTPFLWSYLMVRTELDSPAVAAAVRSAVASVDPKITAVNLRPMSALVNESVAERRFNMLLLAGFASLALLLAAVGLYGVMSYLVTQRTREIGIRMALGARSSDVLRMVVRQAMTLTVIGILIGVAGAMAATRLMESMMFGVEFIDPTVYMVISLILTGVALLACAVPARRATKVDPMIALRYE